MGKVKLLSVQQETRVLGAADPLLPWLTVRQLLFLAAVLELGAAATLLRHREARWAPGLILWLVAVFAAYRLGLWAVGFHGHCPCLGHWLADLPGFSLWADVMFLVTLGLMAAGSVWLLGRGRWGRLRNRWAARFQRSWLRKAAPAGLLLWCLPTLGGSVQSLERVGESSPLQFVVEGKITLQGRTKEILRDADFQVVLSNSHWRIKLSASAPSAVFKETDKGGTGLEIFSISRDWNGGALAHVMAAQTPYPGAIEEYSVLWAIYVLPHIVTGSGFQRIENPFSNQIPRPQVNLRLHRGVRDGMLFELDPVAPYELTRQPPVVSSPNLASRCRVQEWVMVSGTVNVPKQFTLELEHVQPPLERTLVRQYRGIATNVGQKPWGWPMLPPMPDGETITFLDARYDNLAQPLVIGAFQAQGKWPSLEDLKTYPEYRRWSNNSRSSPEKYWIGGTFLVILLIWTAAFAWWLKSDNTNRKKTPI